MARLKLVEGKVYHNPYTSEDFKVIRLDYGADKVEIETGGERKVRSISILQPLVQKSIEDQMQGFEQNLGKDNWSVFIKTLEGDKNTKANQILEKIKTEYVNTEIPEEWINSEYEWFYRIIGNSTKGMIARKLYLGLMESNGRDVGYADDGEYQFSTKEYSGVVDGRKKLIKVACVKMNEKITFNNIRQFQEWDDIVLVCMFPNWIEVFETSKEELLDYLESNPSEVIWAGGQEKKDRIGNDIRQNDYFHWIVEYKKLKETLERN